ncbi:glycoside hydrolase family 30 beta sandwich domain-containing protein [Hymenobacter volaticus]|uniref:Glycosyl hydrolase family 30 beta sandwich domain-containing protein n=1 Tax=Hymenobacter volaticus TaxID=2932254 RepID=A0ABY4GD37_9BACT|nr:glycoside hydrolase family 30 beta sandwich domain-containing protein [Hymenobacter volaticus]UOQ68835.1 hypothetical protein MUN86_25550 [Hymenobacter volaticus]
MPASLLLALLAPAQTPVEWVANLLTYQNPHQSVVVVLGNNTSADQTVRLQLGKQFIVPQLKPHFFNTLLVKAR